MKAADNLWAPASACLQRLETGEAVEETTGGGCARQSRSPLCRFPRDEYSASTRKTQFQANLVNAVSDSCC